MSKIDPIVILGGGPAGLTMGKLLLESGVDDFVIVERESRVGGKCLSQKYDDHLVEFGTCYAIYSHRRVIRWMKQLGLKIDRIRTQNIDGLSSVDYIKSGAGSFLWVQTVKYAYLRHSLLKRLEKGDAKATEIVSMPALSWLKKHKLHKIERLLYRVITTMGYGYLTEVPLLHALRWVDLSLIISGALNYTNMPTDGWQNFWDKLSEKMDVRLNLTVDSIDRSDGILLSFNDGSTLRGRTLINTVPMHELDRLCELSELESRVVDSVSWAGYCMTLISAQQWFTEPRINAWIDSAIDQDLDGRVFVARYEVESSEFGGALYSVGQGTGDYQAAELGEILLEDCRRYGALNPRVIFQKVWPYFPCYSPEAIVGGLLGDMRDLQGANQTFHTGSTFSHESVANVTEFNAVLLSQVLRAG